MFTTNRHRPSVPGGDSNTPSTSVLDVGAKPEATEQPDAGLERERARQAAVNDAGRGVLDVPGLLANDQPLQFIDQVHAWVKHQQEQAQLRAQLHTHAAHGLRHLIETGQDEGARERGAGLTDWRKRHTDATDNQAEAVAVVADAAQTLADRSAPKPASHSQRTLIATWLRKFGLMFVSAPIEGFVLAVALELAVASENPWEKVGLACIVLFGLVTLPHLISAALRRIRYEGEGGWYWAAIALATSVLLALIFGVGYLRNLATQIDLSTGESGGGGGVQRGDGTAPVTEGLTTATPNLYWIFVTIMLVMSTAVFLSGLLSHAPEQLAYIRARRALDRARGRVSATAQTVADIESRLAYQDRDIEETTQAAERYATEVLPTLGDELVEVYITELALQMGDPQFTDALRAMATSRAATPAAGLPEPAAETEASQQ